MELTFFKLVVKQRYKEAGNLPYSLSLKHCLMHPPRIYNTSTLTPQLHHTWLITEACRHHTAPAG